VNDNPRELAAAMPAPARGPVAWMVHNRVTPNLIMMFLLLGGLVMTGRIKKEVFPEFDLDRIEVSVAYPGAGPEEVEQGIVLAIEEQVRGLDGVKEVTAVADEGRGVVNIELLTGADAQAVYQDVRQAVDRITTFPQDAEQPRVELATVRREVVMFALYGAADEWALRNLAEETRDRLLQHPGITQVDLQGVRDYEVQVEAPSARLREYGLTLEDIARRLAATAVELPGGSVRTAGGEILLRFKERRDWAAEFARLPLVTTPGGGAVTLGDVATVREGFTETEMEYTYDGQPAVGLQVYRVGAQTPIGVSDAVRAALAELEPDLPAGVRAVILRDSSDMYRQRLKLLLKNAAMGLVLVLLLLGIFLEIKLALWVTLGIPVSFLGAMLLLPGLGVSINMISLFAFIIALGIVVDDAIVAGENIYEYRQQGMSHFDAAVRGVRDVGVPIAFSILTNIVAFIPLYFVPGIMGKIWRVIPLVVITVFLISWAESIFILPSHLAHTSSAPRTAFTAWLHAAQQAFGRRLDLFVRRRYGALLRGCLRRRGLTVAAALALLLAALGYVRGGHIAFILMPRVESDQAVATASLPLGAPMARLRAVRDRMETAARAVAETGGGTNLLLGIEASIQGPQVEVTAYLTEAGVRPISTQEFTRRWREKAGALTGLRTLVFQADRGGPGSGAALSVELSHRDRATLDHAAQALAEKLREFPVLKDIDDGSGAGKRQFDFQLTAAGRSLGLTSAAVARQVRAAYYGAEAMRQQRGRNEIKVLVRLPAAERGSEYAVDRLLVRTPGGRDVPLREVAAVAAGRAYIAIQRREGRRTLTVAADVDPLSETERVKGALDRSALPQLARDHPGLSYGYQGRQADFRDSTRSLISGLVLALLGIYFLLAIPFRSYVQPLIVMISIPFGIVGAILGHLVMGYDLSVISIMGIIALAGVVVNDALVLIDYANQLRRTERLAPDEAVWQAGVRRFRPILLTTLTTFGGLAPMIFETSRQARFMIPMALSLGYGILFATGISLLLVPCLYTYFARAVKP